jgi:hypothetical protein
LPQRSMRFGVSELSRRGRRIEARTVGNGCSPDGATTCMTARCPTVVSFPIRNGLPGSLCRIHPSLDVDPLTNNDRLVVARTADPNQILDPEPTTTFPI